MLMLSVGSILVGLAVAMVTVVYIARPFRRQNLDVDRAVELWVERARESAARDGAAWEDAAAPVEPASTAPVRDTAEDKDAVRASEAVVNFCPYCGRRVQPDHRFCPGCGKPLPEGDGVKR
jgi:hypothetical protein